MATPSYSSAGLVSGLVTKSLFTPSVQHAPSRLPALALRDQQYGGLHRIVGTVKQVGTPNQPVARRVRLFRMRDGVFIRETWSSTTGDYAFEWIDGSETYFVASFDHTGLYGAVIADGLTPELMP